MTLAKSHSDLTPESAHDAWLHQSADLQRDLFDEAKAGVVPGGAIVAIIHVTEPGEEPTAHRLRPGELRTYFDGWEILHYREGPPSDPAHQRSSAVVVARRKLI